MAEVQKPDSPADREARRALLHEALTELATSDDPERAADEVVRAIESVLHDAPPSRELPVADFSERRETREARVLTWIVVGGAVLATAVVGIALSGGWPAALAIAGVWVVALALLLST